MKDRLIIFALGLSRPGTMGGNSKITLEIARRLSRVREVHFIVPLEKLPTLTRNVQDTNSIHIHAIEDFPKDDKFHPFASCRWFLPRVRDILRSIQTTGKDKVFTCSDFHVDVLPAYFLQKEFSYQWIPSFFLFLPSLFENLYHSYRFPAVKYLIYRVYQRLLFALAKRRASAFVVTNKSDFKEFPSKFRYRLFDFYGGVNLEQIPSASSSKTRDVVFCSRLHPQKGLDAFLDVWARVLKSIPSTRLTVIGNGESAYETFLKDKAKRLSIDRSIDWLGYVNNEAKFKIYRESRVFVHPTVFDNNGMVAAEALCSELPVVMQDIPSLRDVYSTGCVKVPFGDKDAFAAAVIKLLSDKSALAAAIPSAKELEELRVKWDWSTRVAAFNRFLDML